MKVKLHGVLSHKFKEEIDFPFEVHRSLIFDALSANLSGFKLFIQRKAQDGVVFEIVETDQNYDIVPIICGNIGSLSALGGQLFMNAAMGLTKSFAIGGILSMLSPSEEDSSSAVDESVVLQSTRFSNLENKEGQGSKVPVGYGRLRIASKLVMQYTEPQSWAESRDIENVSDFSYVIEEYLNPTT